jgi:hypothetical protein
VRPPDRAIQAFDRAGIGAGDDLQVLIAARVDRGLHLLHHLVERDHVLAGEVAALLGKYLVLDLQSRRAGALEHAHGAHHVDGIAEPRIGIDDQRQRHGVGNRGHRVGDLGEGGEADVGRTQVHVGDAGSRDIDHLEPQLLDHAGEQRVRRAGRLHGRAPRDDLLQPVRRFHRRSPQ